MLPEDELVQSFDDVFLVFRVVLVQSLNQL